MENKTEGDAVGGDAERALLLTRELVRLAVGPAHGLLESLIDLLERPTLAALVLNPLEVAHSDTTCVREDVREDRDAAIEQGLGRIEQEVLEAVEQERPGFAGGWISSVFLDRLLTDLRKDGAMPPNKRRDLLVGLGYQWHPHLPKGRVHNIVLPDAGKPKLFIRKGHPAAALRLPAEIARAYTTAQGVA